MILEAILLIFFNLIKFIINLLPNIPLKNYDLSGLSRIISVGSSLLPTGFFTIFIASIILWNSTSMIWSIIEWLYKKIPGVD